MRAKIFGFEPARFFSRLVMLPDAQVFTKKWIYEMMTLSVFIDFPWPPVNSGSSTPIWTGLNFNLGGEMARVLNYDINPSNWSEELTELHEKEAGSQHPMDLASRQLAVRTMKEIKTSQPVIMDVGCSSGYLVSELKAAMPEASLIGADFIRGPLERLASTLPGVPLLQFDLRRCPLPDESLDGVTCLNVLEHIDDDERSLRQIWRILKPGGLAHIEVPAGPDLFDMYDDFLMHYRRYSMKGLVALARRCGFIVEKTTHLGFMVYPAFWVCKKRGQRARNATTEEKARLVAGFIQTSRTSRMFSAVIKFEIEIGRIFSYPCGVRCVATLRKPEANELALDPKG